MKFPQFKQVKFISMQFSHVCLLDSASMWKRSAHKHSGSSFQVLTCFVTVVVYIVLKLYFLKEINKKTFHHRPFSSRFVPLLK